MLHSEYRRMSKNAFLSFNYSIYLQVTWSLGKGVMFVSHLQDYLYCIDEISKSTIWRALREMERAKLISIHKFYNNCYIKLRKKGVEIGASKSSVAAKSISITPTLLKKTAAINEFIILQLDEIIEKNNIYRTIDLIKHLKNQSTLFMGKREGFHFLNNDKIFNKNEFLSSEIENLEKLYLNGLKKMNSPYNETVVKNYKFDFTINNMSYRSIFASSFKDKGAIDICLFDMGKNYDIKKVANNLMDVQIYFASIAPGKELNYFICFTDEEFQQNFTRQLDEFKTLLLQKGFKSPKLNLSNLNLTRKIFSNVRIIN